MKLGAQVRAARKAKGWSQKDLGEKLGITFQAVGKLERGETATPRNARRLMQVLGLTPAQILGSSDSPISERATHVALLWEDLPDSVKEPMLAILEDLQHMTMVSPGVVEMMFSTLRESSRMVHEPRMAAYKGKTKRRSKAPPASRD